MKLVYLESAFVPVLLLVWKFLAVRTLSFLFDQQDWLIAFLLCLLAGLISQIASFGILEARGSIVDFNHHVYTCQLQGLFEGDKPVKGAKPLWTKEYTDAYFGLEDRGRAAILANMTRVKSTEKITVFSGDDSEPSELVLEVFEEPFAKLTKEELKMLPEVYVPIRHMGEIIREEATAIVLYDEYWEGIVKAENDRNEILLQIGPKLPITDENLARCYRGYTPEIRKMKKEWLIKDDMYAIFSIEKIKLLPSSRKCQYMEVDVSREDFEDIRASRKTVALIHPDLDSDPYSSVKFCFEDKWIEINRFRKKYGSTEDLVNGRNADLQNCFPREDDWVKRQELLLSMANQKNKYDGKEDSDTDSEYDPEHRPFKDIFGNICWITFDYNEPYPIIYLPNDELGTTAARKLECDGMVGKPIEIDVPRWTVFIKNDIVIIRLKKTSCFDDHSYLNYLSFCVEITEIVENGDHLTLTVIPRE